MDARLAGAIGTAGIQKQAVELMRRAVVALDHLGRLDESLYERFVATHDPGAAAALSPENMRALWQETFAGLLELLAFLGELGSGEPKPEAAPSAAHDDLDFGELAMGASEPGSALDADLGLADIGDVLENIEEHSQAGEAERWKGVLEQAASIRYGLQSQYDDSLERTGVALAAGQIRHALALMDDAQGTASEGVHALVTGLYQAFLPDVDPASILPGYLTLLDRALLVRGALTELGAALGPLNDAVQGADRAGQEAALTGVRETVETFLGSPACRAMRPADRWQLGELARALREGSPTKARQTSEGLVKYLESLGAINQREVLLRHDERALDELRESLASARQLVDLSPRATADLLDRGSRAAARLRGRHLRTDRLLSELEEEEPRLRQERRFPQLLERLEAFLAAAGG